MNTETQGSTILSGGATPAAETAAANENITAATTEATTTTEAATVATGGDPAATTTEAPDWRVGLSDELKDNASIGSFKTTADLAKGYINAVKKIGVDKINVPTQHTTPEEWNEVFSKLGLPAEIDKYEVSLPKDQEDTGGVFASF